MGAPRGSWLTFADRRKGGLTNWDRHHRIPPGRRALPRLKDPQGEQAVTPRGGRDRREAGISDFDFIS